MPKAAPKEWFMARDVIREHQAAIAEAERDLARAKEELAQARAQERTNDKEDS